MEYGVVCMPGKMISVKLSVKSKQVRDELEELISSMEWLHLHENDAPSSCDLLIYEIGQNGLNPQEEFQLVRETLKSGVAREIYLTSSSLEPEILLQALRAGAKEFFPQPIKREEVKGALLELKVRRGEVKIDGEKQKEGKIIYAIGSKGGVGTSTVAVNLAASLKDSKGSPSVVLIDMNLLSGEIPIFLDIEAAFSWGEVFGNISRLDSTYLMSILSKHSSGIYVLPSPKPFDGLEVATPELIETLLGLMRKMFDYIVIDGGQSLGDISLKFLEMSDLVLLISILNVPCLTNVKRLLWTFQRLGYPEREKIKIIVNRNSGKSEISAKEAEKSINNKIFWLIPNDYGTTMSAINQGKTISSMARESRIRKNFEELALSLSEKGN
jgi:pilus assembly protein CpaE